MQSIYSLVKKHENFRKNCINLLPSENILSDKSKNVLSSDLTGRYTLPINQEVHGVYVENAYRGTKFIDEIETNAENLAKKVFNFKFVSLKPLSGHIAGLIMLLSVCKKGDKIFSISAENGGYDGYMQNYLPDILSLKSYSLPFEQKNWNLDYEKCEQEILKEKPSLVILGASYILFPYDVKRIKEVCEKVNCKIGYDASHVLGLIAGKQFQNLGNVDIAIGSTHKSFFGCQGGLILTNNEEIFKKVKKNLTWRTIDNAHWNKIASLGITLEEFKKFGESYSLQVIKNSKKLAKELNKEIKIKYEEKGFTETHQIFPDLEKLKQKYNLNCNSFAKILEKNFIITDAVGRIGTNETTRIGMKQKEMKKISELIVKSVKGKNVKREVVELKRNFRKVKYC